MVARVAKRLLGMSGVPPGDNARAYLWEKRLHPVMIAIALIALIAFYLTEFSHAADLVMIGHGLECLIFGVFFFELVWMTAVCEQKLLYLRRNWLDLVIVACSGLALLGVDAQWVAGARLLRLATVALLLTRALRPMRSLLTPGGLPYVGLIAVIIFLVSGAAFYWLEPTVRSYADGLWLAFVTGATIGYGDIVPSTTASRLFAVLITMVGLTLFSLVTASVAAFFVGEDEKTQRREMHRDLQRLKEDVARLFREEEALLLREMHADVRGLREELQRLRHELEQLRRSADGGRDA
jgi:voltage-gated potassium channel